MEQNKRPEILLNPDQFKSKEAYEQFVKTVEDAFAKGESVTIRAGGQDLCVLLPVTFAE
jgi:hypothetical protein